MEEMTKDEFKKNLGEKIKARRYELHMTLEVLSEKAGTSFENLKKIEKGGGMPPSFLLAKIADALGIQVDELLPGKELRKSKSEEVTKLESFYLRLTPDARQSLFAIAEQLLTLEKKLKGK